ncbi:unnamed protein product, partial [Symbiodinium pilosum]
LASECFAAVAAQAGTSACSRCTTCTYTPCAICAGDDTHATAATHTSHHTLLLPVAALSYTASPSFGSRLFEPTPGDPTSSGHFPCTLPANLPRAASAALTSDAVLQASSSSAGRTGPSNRKASRKA